MWIDNKELNMMITSLVADFGIDEARKAIIGTVIDAHFRSDGAEGAKAWIDFVLDMQNEGNISLTEDEVGELYMHLRQLDKF